MEYRYQQRYVLLPPPKAAVVVIREEGGLDAVELHAGELIGRAAYLGLDPVSLVWRCQDMNVVLILYRREPSPTDCRLRALAWIARPCSDENLHFERTEDMVTDETSGDS